MGRAINRHGDGGRAAPDGNASGFQSRRGAAVRAATFSSYHAPNFGDSATTFTKQQNFAGPDQFFIRAMARRWGRRCPGIAQKLLSLLHVGRVAIYLEPRVRSVFKPGPGEHPLQLNPLGRITTSSCGL